MTQMPRTLTAAGKPLSTAPARLGAMVPTRSTAGLDAIRAAYVAQGYVWITGLLDRDAVLAFRSFVFGHLGQAGLLAPGSDPAVGLPAETFDKGAVDARLMALVRSARYEAFCAQPRLTALIDPMLNGLSYLHRRKIMRFTRAGSGVSTPAHYDLVYLRGGTSNLVTAWIPLGDTPVAMGGLMYLAGSDTLGRRMEAEFTAKATDLPEAERISAYNRHMSDGGWVSKDLAGMADRFDTQWHVADYTAGDVVLHSPWMIHAAPDNADPEGRMRLSTDIRFQNVDEEVDVRWSNHWSLGDML